jgi:hypothetical protein
VGDDAVARSFHGEMLADRAQADACLAGQRISGQVHGFRAGLVRFLRAGSDRAYDCQFLAPVAVYR